MSKQPRATRGAAGTTRQAALLRQLIAATDLEDSAPASLAHACFPGTAERIDVMLERRRLRQCLYHPGDLTMVDALAMGFMCTKDTNGAAQWFRPLDERSRRSLILSAQAALRAQRQAGGKAGGKG